MVDVRVGMMEGRMDMKMAGMTVEMKVEMMEGMMVVMMGN